MTNSKALREAIAERGLMYKFLAKEMGLSINGLMFKIDNKSDFKADEITALCGLLGIKSLREKERIFFAKEEDLKSTQG